MHFELITLTCWNILLLFFDEHLWTLIFQHPTTLDTSFNSITDLVFVICKFFPIKMCYFKLSCFSPGNSCKRIKRGTHFKILSKALECAAYFWTLYSTRPFFDLCYITCIDNFIDLQYKPTMLDGFYVPWNNSESWSIVLYSLKTHNIKH